MKAMRVSNLDAYKIEATYVFLPKNFSFRLKHFVVDKIQIQGPLGPMHSLSTAFVTFCMHSIRIKHVAWMSFFLLSWEDDDFSRGNE